MSVQEASQQQQAAKAAKPQVAKAGSSPFAATQPTPEKSSASDAQPEKKKYVPEPLTEDQAMSRCRNVLDRVSARTALRVAAYLTQRAQDALDEAAPQRTGSGG